MSKWIYISVRVTSKQQRARFAKAAKTRRWSLNSFMVEAAERLARSDKYDAFVIEEAEEREDEDDQPTTVCDPLGIEQLVELDSHPLTYLEQNNNVTEPTNNSQEE